MNLYLFLKKINFTLVHKFNYIFSSSKYLINNILKIIIFYLLLKFKNYEIIKKKIIEIDNKINESLYENNLDFSNYSSDIKIITTYFPPFLNNKTYIENIFNNLNNSYFDENIKSSFIKSQNLFQIKCDNENYCPLKNSNFEIIKEQVKLAKEHGIYGFAIFYYWFSGTKLYDEELNIFIENKEINFHFLIIWKNDNYEININNTKKILIKQEYNEKDPKILIKDIKKFLISKNYIKINEKPVLFIYEYSKLLKIKNFLINLRKEAIENNIGEIFILGNMNEFEEYYKIEFFHLVNINLINLINNNNYNICFRLIYNNTKYINNKIYLNNFKVNNTFEINTNINDNIFFDFNEYYQEKLYLLFKRVIKIINNKYQENNRFILFNGWNNLKQRIYLEPDKIFGYASLNTLSKALFNLPFCQNKNINWSNNCIIVVQAHIFYDDLTLDIINKTNNIPLKFDLFISTTTNEKKEIILKYIIKYSRANKYNIIVVKNLGRDVFPLLIQLKNNFKRYKYLCHIHSKKSKTSPEIGIKWRNYLYNNLLGNSAIVKGILYDFENIDKLGFIFPETYYEIIKQSLILTKTTKKYMQYILNRLFFLYKLGNKLIFPAGNMFWAKFNAIYQIFEYNFNLNFFKEKDLTNDTIMHGIERIWLYLVKINGYYYKKVFKII